MAKKRLKKPYRDIINFIIKNKGVILFYLLILVSTLILIYDVKLNNY